MAANDSDSSERPAMDFGQGSREQSQSGPRSGGNVHELAVAQRRHPRAKPVRPAGE